MACTIFPTLEFLISRCERQFDVHQSPPANQAPYGNRNPPGCALMNVFPKFSSGSPYIAEIIRLFSNFFFVAGPKHLSNEVHWYWILLQRCTMGDDWEIRHLVKVCKIQSFLLFFESVSMIFADLKDNSFLSQISKVYFQSIWPHIFTQEIPTCCVDFEAIFQWLTRL